MYPACVSYRDDNYAHMASRLCVCEGQVSSQTLDWNYLQDHGNGTMVN